LPDQAHEVPQRGTVLEVGRGKLLDNGEVARRELKVGDVVIFGKYTGVYVEVNGIKYKIIRESEVLAVDSMV